MSENASPSPAPDKWALLIGINRYAYAASYGFYDLDGCINDVADMKAVLIGKFNFPPHHIKVLQDKQATRQAILEAIRTQLVENARLGDIVVLYYSGHGSEMPNPGRINGHEQTIIPYDGRDPDGQVLDISGADLNLAFATLKTRNSTFIFDSCHSGSIRFRKDGKIRSIRPDDRFEVESPRSIAQPMPSGQLRPPGAAYALLAACAQNELSVETNLNGKPRGLLTYFLCRELRQSTRAQTYRDLMDNLKGAIASENPTQHPQLEGVAVDTCLFEDEEIAVQPYVLVSPQGKNEVRFSAGAEIGMTSGSIYEIHAPGAKLLARPESVLATVQVTDVRDFNAIGYINAGGPVLENSRAIETVHYHQAPVARIEINGWEADATLAKIRLALVQFTQLQLSAPPDHCDIKLWQEAGYIRMESSSGILSAKIADDLAAVESIAQRIQHWAQWLNLMALNNPAQPALDVRFSIAPFEEDYYPGSQVECIVENNSDIDLYITILDFASDGSIQVIFPVEDPPVLMANHTLRKLFSLEHASPEQERSGDVLKLIASARQQDFRILEMRGFRGAPVPQDHFGQLLSAAMFGASKGETQWLQPPDWIAINRGLFMRARAATVIAKP